MDSERTHVKDTSPLSRREIFLGSGMEDEEDACAHAGYVRLGREPGVAIRQTVVKWEGEGEGCLGR